MTSVLTSPSTSTPTVSRRAARRFGYGVAILVNLVFVWLINGWPGWEAVPFVTAEAADVIPLINLSLGVTIAANLVYLVADGVRVKALGELVISLVNVAVTATILDVFPFDFSGYWAGWDWLARFVLVIVLIGTSIAVVVNLVRLVRGPAQRT